MGEQESLLGITDHLTRYPQVILTCNQKATATAWALFDNVFIYYGFPG